MIEDIRYSNNINWPLFILLVVLLFFLLFLFDEAIANEKTIAEKIMPAMGGSEVWESVCALRFDFEVHREVSWPGGKSQVLLDEKETYGF